MATRARMAEFGVSKYLASDLVRRGLINKVRTGWYRLPVADPYVIDAVKSRCVLSGAHALKFYGGWVPHEAVRHYTLTSPTSTSDPAIRVHRHPRMTKAQYSNGIIPWKSALKHALSGIEVPEQVAIIDSLHNSNRSNRIDRAELLKYVAHLRGAKVLSLCDARADSGIESVARVRLVLQGHHVRSQVPIGHHQSIDLVVDGILALEIDGATHSNPEQWRRDMRKNNALLDAGYLGMRLSYWDVVDGWEAAYSRMLGLLVSARS